MRSLEYSFVCQFSHQIWNKENKDKYTSLTRKPRWQKIFDISNVGYSKERPRRIRPKFRSAKPKQQTDKQTPTSETHHLVQKSRATILLRPTGATGRHRALKTSITLNTGQGIVRARTPLGMNSRPEDALLCLISKEWESSQPQQPGLGHLQGKGYGWRPTWDCLNHIPIKEKTLFSQIVCGRFVTDANLQINLEEATAMS